MYKVLLFKFRHHLCKVSIDSFIYIENFLFCFKYKFPIKFILMLINSGKDHSISFPTKTTVCFIKEYWSSVKKQNNGVGDFLII